jgi:hypothetical protein
MIDLGSKRYEGTVTMTNGKYVSIQAAHRYLTEFEGLKLSLNGVYDKCRSGELQAVLLSGKWHIPSTELLEYPNRLMLAARNGLLSTSAK